MVTTASAAKIRNTVNKARHLFLYHRGKLTLAKVRSFPPCSE